MNKLQSSIIEEGSEKKMLSYTPSHHVLEIWNTISKGLDEALNYTDGDTDKLYILSDLLSARTTLHLIHDKDYAGFVIVRPVQTSSAEKTLYIECAYLIKGVDGGVFFKALGELETIGKNNGFNVMRFRTLRDESFERRFKGQGWKQSYVEFKKDITKLEEVR